MEGTWGSGHVPAETQNHFRKLLTPGQYVILQPQTPETGAIVQELCWVHNLVLKGQDAFHVAAALEFGVSEFISTDDRLRTPKMVTINDAVGKTRGVRFICASLTSALPPEYLQGDMYNG
jgi:hypothetical protein